MFLCIRIYVYLRLWIKKNHDNQYFFMFPSLYLQKKTVKVTDKDMLVEYTEISPYRIDYLYVLSITGR